MLKRHFAICLRGKIVKDFPDEDGGVFNPHYPYKKQCSFGKREELRRIPRKKGERLSNDWFERYIEEMSTFSSQIAFSLYSNKKSFSSALDQIFIFPFPGVLIIELAKKQIKSPVKWNSAVICKQP